MEARQFALAISWSEVVEKKSVTRVFAEPVTLIMTRR